MLEDSGKEIDSLDADKDMIQKRITEWLLKI